MTKRLEEILKEIIERFEGGQEECNWCKSNAIPLICQSIIEAVLGALPPFQDTPRIYKSNEHFRNGFNDALNWVKENLTSL